MCSCIESTLIRVAGRPGAICRILINSIPLCVALSASRTESARKVSSCGGLSRNPIPPGIHGFLCKAGKSRPGSDPQARECGRRSQKYRLRKATHCPSGSVRPTKPASACSGQSRSARGFAYYSRDTVTTLITRPPAENGGSAPAPSTHYAPGITEGAASVAPSYRVSPRNSQPARRRTTRYAPSRRPSKAHRNRHTKYIV